MWLLLPTVKPMSLQTARPRPGALSLALVPSLALTLAASTLVAGGTTASAVEPSPGHPTNAGAIFKWGNPAWHDEFKTQAEPLGWEVSEAGTVVNRNGMLTLMAGREDGLVTATSTEQAAAEGRWEARVRMRNYRGTGARYRVFWELVPADGAERCGASGIVMASYRVNAKRAKGAVRTLPDLDFRFGRKLNLARDEFHTFAVEVTSDHISWFVDTKVVRTERRPEALSGVTFKPRFRVQGIEGQQMKPAWMQMDWARYYTLARPNRKSIEAKPMRLKTYPTPC